MVKCFGFTDGEGIDFLCRYAFDNNVDGLYIAPAFMDKVVIHITKNFLNLPNIKVSCPNSLMLHF